MRKRTYLLLAWFACLIVFVVIASTLPLLNYSLLDVTLWISTEQLVFTLILLVIVLTLF